MPFGYAMANQEEALPRDTSGERTSNMSSGNFLYNLNSSPPDFREIYYYKHSSRRDALYIAASVISSGILPLIAFYFPMLSTCLRKHRVPDFESGADHVLTHESTRRMSGWNERKLQKLEIVDASNTKILLHWFKHKERRYFYDSKQQKFVCLKSELREAWSDIEKRIKLPAGSRSGDSTGAGAPGYSTQESKNMLDIFGPNVDTLASQCWKSTLYRKLSHPLYIMQAVCILICYEHQYEAFASVVLVASFASVLWEMFIVFGKLPQISRDDTSVRVIRENRVQSVSRVQLVVGDLLVIEEGVVPADVVLIAGNCTTDETNLSGEAFPLLKRSLTTTEKYMTYSGMKQDTGRERIIDGSMRLSEKESVLLAGSRVVDCKSDFTTRGVVLSTGFATFIGDLTWTITFAKNEKVCARRDSYVYLGTVCSLALFALMKRWIQISEQSIEQSQAFHLALRVIPMAIPPILPILLTVAICLAIIRLKSANITCSDSERVHLAGKIDTVCFDKTGTLTSDCLDFQGMNECNASASATLTARTGKQVETANAGPPSFIGLQVEVDVLSVTSIIGLSACHSLTERNGAVSGYALELDMFRATGYSIESNAQKLQQPGAASALLIRSPIGKTFGVVKRYAFDAHLQRSSVLVEDFETRLRVVYSKGSPDSIIPICNFNTVPSDYRETMRTYSYQGYYVLAMASKAYPVTQDIPVREAMECRLNFLGFIVFLNKIRDESPYVISTLEDARTDVRIITGDSAYNAMHVARKINMELQSEVILIDIISTEQATNVQGATLPAKSRLVYANIDDLATTRKSSNWSDLDIKSFLTLADNNEIAVNGKALELLLKYYGASKLEFVEQIVVHAKVFSRVTPQQKTWIINVLIKYGKHVAMVGDGANDYGALNAAHVGLSISTANSIAPFISQEKSITDIIELLRQGRCASSSCFVAYKYMVVCAIVQLSLSSMMNDSLSQMSTNQLLWDDLGIIFTLALMMMRSLPSDALSSIHTRSLFSPTVLVSLFGQLMLYFCCIGTAISAARTSDWFCAATTAYDLKMQVDASVMNGTYPNVHVAASHLVHSPCYLYKPGTAGIYTQHSYENSVLWLFGHMQYYIVAMALNIKDSNRRSIFSNLFFVICLLALFIILQIQLFNYKSDMTSHAVRMDTSFGLLALSTAFCVSLFFLSLADLALANLWEYLIVGNLLQRLEQRSQHFSSSTSSASSLSGRHGICEWLIATLSGRQTFKDNKSSLVADHDSLLADFENKDKVAVTANHVGLRRASSLPLAGMEQDDEEIDIEIGRRHPLG